MKNQSKGGENTLTTTIQDETEKKPESHTRTLSHTQILNISEVIAKQKDTTQSEIMECLIQWFYNVFICKDDAYNLVSASFHSNKQDEYLNLVNAIYNEVVPPYSSSSRLHELLGLDDFNIIENVLEPKKHDKIIRYDVGSDVTFITNLRTQKVIRVTQSKSKDARNKTEVVIDAAPTEVVVYDSILVDQPRSFKITWSSSKSQKHFVTGGETGSGGLSEIKEYILNSLFCPNPRYLESAIAAVVNSFIQEGKAIIKKDIENPGFYINPEDGKLIIINYDYKLPVETELIRGIDTLEKLSEFYKGNEDKLASVVKWGFMSAFSYAMKQLGNKMEYLYLTGTSQSGKTTAGQLTLYMWSVPVPDENDIGGSSFDTVARVGAKISKDTFPLLVSEPMGALKRHSVVEMLKSAQERTSGRGKFVGGTYKTIPAFSLVLFTSNHDAPEDDSLLNRFYKINFSYNERKTPEEKKAFKEAFNIENTKVSRINDLKAISNFFVQEIKDNPEMLNDDWKETADTIIHRLYADIGREVPDWLYQWVKSESLEDFDNNQREEFRGFLINQFNREFRKIQVIDPNTGYSRENDLVNPDVNSTKEFKGRIWNVINERLISWIIPVEIRGTKYVCFTQGVRKSLHQDTEICANLKSIAEMLDWRYVSVRLSEGAKPTMVMRVSLDHFLNYLYPDYNNATMEDVEEDGDL